MQTISDLQTTHSKGVSIGAGEFIQTSNERCSPSFPTVCELCSEGCEHTGPSMNRHQEAGTLLALKAQPPWLHVGMLTQRA